MVDFAEPEAGSARRGSTGFATLRSVAGTRFSGVSSSVGFAGGGRFAQPKRAKWLQTARHGRARRVVSSAGPGSEMGFSMMSRKSKAARGSVRGSSIHEQVAAQQQASRQGFVGAGYWRDSDDTRSIYSLARELDAAPTEEGEDDGSEDVASVISLSMLSGFGPGTHGDFRTPCNTQAPRR